jgi:RNA 2',3'-cyclic 3'-phosphodiesterase
MDSKLRTFIAVELSSTLQQSLQEIQSQLKPLDLEVSWVKPTNIHITLKFLGEIAPKKVKAINEIFPEIFKDFSSFEIGLGRLGVFPSIARPNVIWVGIEQGLGEMKKLAESLENAVCRLGFSKERREFIPHLTLGRFRSLKNCGSLAKAIENFPPQRPTQQIVSRVIFFRSTLSAQGSLYEPLATAYLSS